MKQGWEIKKLKDVILEIKDGGTPSRTKPEYFGGNVNWCVVKDILPEIHSTKETLTELGLSKCSAKVWPINSVIISLGATIGQVGIAKIPVATKQGISGIIVNEKLVKPELLVYYLNFKKEFIQNAATGATIKEIRPSKLAEILEFPLPPLPEQQRIVAFLDEAFAAIAQAKAHAEQNLQNAKALFESYLQGVFAPSTSSGASARNGWEEKTLEELVDKNCSLSYGIVQPGEEFENGLPIIRPTDLTSRYIKLNGLKRINPKLAEGYKRTRLLGEELLLCVRGTTGVVSIATPELKDANVTRGIVPIRFDAKLIRQDFGYYLLISDFVQQQIKAKTYGTALMQINIGDLRKIQTPFPSLETQQTIVRQLDVLRAETQRLEAVYRQKLEDLEELKKSVLAKAFRGELTEANLSN